MYNYNWIAILDLVSIWIEDLLRPWIDQQLWIFWTGLIGRRISKTVPTTGWIHPDQVLWSTTNAQGITLRCGSAATLFYSTFWWYSIKIVLFTYQTAISSYHIAWFCLSEKYPQGKQRTETRLIGSHSIEFTSASHSVEFQSSASGLQW